MIVQLLGLLDVAVAVSSLLMAYGIYSRTLMLAFSVYLIAKSLVFFSSLASIIDFASGIVILAAVYWTMPPIVLGIVFLALIQKGAFSFF